MNEWKLLQIDNLPPDILTGDYEFNYGDMYSDKEGNFSLDEVELSQRERIIEAYLNYQSHSYVRYRKPEPLPPTHKEIMSHRFWQCDNPLYWRQITGVRIEKGKTQYLIYDGWCDSDYFTGRESADIPPETE